MFGMTGLHELIVLMLLIAVLSATDLWPRVVRGLRELRGEDLPPDPGDDLDMCYRILGLRPSATWRHVEQAYRAKAALHHPDHGGDGDTMRALNEAYTRIKRTRGPGAPAT